MPGKTYKNPITNEAKTAQEWAEIYEYSSEDTFRAYYSKCLRAGREQDAFCSKRQRKEKGINKLNRLKLKKYKDGKTAQEWANKLRISKNCFHGRVGKYPDDDPRIYMTPEEMKACKNKAISEANKKNKSPGPRVPIKMRRGNLKKEIGTWEQENIENRWSHIKGEP